METLLLAMIFVAGLMVVALVIGLAILRAQEQDDDDYDEMITYTKEKK
jgi:uncharacterized membrane protein YciS (DUF1049 family)